MAAPCNEFWFCGSVYLFFSFHFSFPLLLLTLAIIETCAVIFVFWILLYISKIKYPGFLSKLEKKTMQLPKTEHMPFMTLVSYDSYHVLSLEILQGFPQVSGFFNSCVLKTNSVIVLLHWLYPDKYLFVSPYRNLIVAPCHILMHSCKLWLEFSHYADRQSKQHYSVPFSCTGEMEKTRITVSPLTNQPLEIRSLYGLHVGPTHMSYIFTIALSKKEYYCSYDR